MKDFAVLGEQDVISDRSLVYKLLSRAWQYPDNTVYTWLAGKFQKALKRGLKASGTKLETSVIPPQKSQVKLAADYTSNFDVGLAKPACSLNEGLCSGLDRLTVFKELVLFYNHFGLSSADSKFLPDHLVMELEFMHYLSFKEEVAISQKEDPYPYIRAQRDFLERHLICWLPKIRDGVKILEIDPFYPSLSEFTFQWVHRDLQSLSARVLQVA